LPIARRKRRRRGRKSKEKKDKERTMYPQVNSNLLVEVLSGEEKEYCFL
jgi:hypothetical protein